MPRFSKFNEEKIGGYPGAVLKASRSLRGLLSAPERWAYQAGVLDIGRLTLPRFLGLGAPQGGSKWLHVNLQSHPGLFLPEGEKELHYFDRNFQKPLSSYAARFRAAGSRVPGEITPGYSVLDRRQIRFISRIMPEVRLVYILRNPVEQRLSMARRALSKESANPFVLLPERRVLDLLMNANGKPGRYEPGLQRHQYARILENWWSVFAREQMLLGFFEEIRTHPADLLQRVAAHVGAKLVPEWRGVSVDRAVNANPQVEVPERYVDFLRTRYRNEIEELYQLLGDSVAGWRS